MTAPTGSCLIMILVYCPYRIRQSQAVQKAVHPEHRHHTRGRYPQSKGELLP